MNLQELYRYSSLSATVRRVRDDKTANCQLLIETTSQRPKLQYMLNTHILFCRGDSRLCRLASCAVSGVCSNWMPIIVKHRVMKALV